MLTVFDNVIILLVALLILGISMFFSRTVTDMESYYLGRRSLPWSLTVGALVATWYGGSGTLGSVEYYAIYGLSLWLVWCVTAHTGRIPLALWIGPKMQLRTDITVPDLLNNAYGKGVAILAAVFMLIYCLQFANITTVGFVGKVAWGLPYIVTGSVVVGMVIFIAVTAGLMGVAVTDMLLFWCLGFSVAIIVPLQWGNVGGWDGIVSALGSKPELLDPVGGVTPMKAIMLIVLAFGVYSDPTFYQRFSASESPSAGRRSLLSCFVIWIMFDIVLVVTGLIVDVLYPDMAPGLGYVTLVLTTLPPGVRALFIIALIGSAISALDGYFLSGAATLANDIYGKIKPNPSQKEIVFLSRVCVVLLGVGGLFFAFKFTVAMDAFIFLGSVWMSAGFIPIVGALFNKTRMTPMGGYLSIIFGAGTFIDLRFFPIPSFEIEPLVVAIPASFIAWLIGNRIGKSVGDNNTLQKGI